MVLVGRLYDRLSCAPGRRGGGSEEEVLAAKEDSGMFPTCPRGDGKVPRRSWYRWKEREAGFPNLCLDAGVAPVTTNPLSDSCTHVDMAVG